MLYTLLYSPLPPYSVSIKVLNLITLLWSPFLPFCFLWTSNVNCSGTYYLPLYYVTCELQLKRSTLFWKPPLPTTCHMLYVSFIKRTVLCCGAHLLATICHPNMLHVSFNCSVLESTIRLCFSWVSLKVLNLVVEPTPPFVFPKSTVNFSGIHFLLRYMWASLKKL